MADSYPAASLSLRSASAENIVLQVEDGGAPWTLGEVDMASAPWMVHPRAVYLHEGQQYFVQELNLATQMATLIPVGLDYYTEPQRQTEVKILTENDRSSVPGGEKGWGDVQVTLQVAGFKKLRWFTRENLGLEPLDLPPTRIPDQRVLAGFIGTDHRDSAGSRRVDQRPERLWPRLEPPAGGRPPPGWLPLPDLRRAGRGRPPARCASQGSVPGVQLGSRGQPHGESHHPVPGLPSQSRAECAHALRAGRTGKRAGAACSALPDVRPGRSGPA